jgi:hypothetical protein
MATRLAASDKALAEKEELLRLAQKQQDAVRALCLVSESPKPVSFSVSLLVSLSGCARKWAREPRWFGWVHQKYSKNPSGNFEAFWKEVATIAFQGREDCPTLEPQAQPPKAPQSSACLVM